MIDSDEEYEKRKSRDKFKRERDDSMLHEKEYNQKMSQNASSNDSKRDSKRYHKSISIDTSPPSMISSSGGGGRHHSSYHHASAIGSSSRHHSHHHHNASSKNSNESLYEQRAYMNSNTKRQLHSDIMSSNPNKKVRKSWADDDDNPMYSSYYQHDNREEYSIPSPTSSGGGGGGPQSEYYKMNHHKYNRIPSSSYERMAQQPPPPPHIHHQMHHHHHHHNNNNHNYPHHPMMQPYRYPYGSSGSSLPMHGGLMIPPNYDAIPYSMNKFNDNPNNNSIMFETQPQMLSFKAFLQTLNQNLTPEQATKRYNEYKNNFRKEQIELFFDVHKNEEWFKLRYHPDDSDKRKEEYRNAIKRRLNIFMDLYNKGWLENINCDMDNYEKLRKYLYAVIIKLEDGSDDDLKILMENNTVDTQQINGKSNENSEVLAVESSNDKAKVDKNEIGYKSNQDDNPLNAATADADDADYDKDDMTVDSVSKAALAIVNKSIQSKNVNEIKNERKKNDNAESDKESGMCSDSDSSSSSHSSSSSGSSSDDSSDNSSESNSSGSSSSSSDDDDDDDDSNASSDSESDKEKKKSKKKKLKIKNKLKKKKAKKQNKKKKSSNKKINKKGESVKEKSKVNEEKAVKQALALQQQQQNTPFIPSIQIPKRVQSIFFKNLPVTTTRQELEEIGKRFPGYKRVAISEPAPERGFQRRAWLTFDVNVDIKDICTKINEIKLNGTHLNASVNREIDERIRTVSALANHKIILLNDVKLISKIVANMDKRWCLWEYENEMENIKAIEANQNYKKADENDNVEKIMSENSVNEDDNENDDENGVYSNKKDTKKADDSVVIIEDTDLKANNEHSLKEDESSKLKTLNPLLLNITEYLVDEMSAEEDDLLTGNAKTEPSTATNNSKLTGGTNPNIQIKFEKDLKLASLLDKLILYLRIVHSIDYYNITEYQQEDWMPNRLGILHARERIATLASSTQSSSKSSSSIKVKKADIDEYIKLFEMNIKSYVDYKEHIDIEMAKRLGFKDTDNEVEKFLNDNCKELEKDKWLCPLSGKKFKAKEYVHKHLLSKHQDKIENLRKLCEFFNNFVYDPKRPYLPEHPLTKLNNSNNNNMAINDAYQLGVSNQPHYQTSSTTMPYNRPYNQQSSYHHNSYSHHQQAALLPPPMQYPPSGYTNRHSNPNYYHHQGNNYRSSGLSMQSNIRFKKF